MVLLIDSLPIELLSSIFVALTTAYPKGRSPHIPLEITLSHVSRRWRYIAFATAKLWCRITIYSPLAMDWVPLYLQRSRSMAVNILIDSYKWERSWHQRYVQTACRNFIQMVAVGILPHFNRIRHLVIKSFEETICRIILGFILTTTSPTTNLQHLEVKFAEPIPLYIPRPPIIAILQQGSPQLTYLETELGVCMPILSSLQNLTTLHLQRSGHGAIPTYLQLVNILTASHTLLFLHLEGSHSFDDWPLVQHVEHGFQLNHIKALRLSKWLIGAAGILMLISAPRLESLWLQWAINKYECHLIDSPQIAGIPGVGKFPELRYLTLISVLQRNSPKYSQVSPTCISRATISPMA